MSVILKAENISKQYRLGLVGSSTLKDDLRRSWYTLRGKDDPFLKIGESNDRTTKGRGDYVWALRDINFEVDQGEVIGIIGKNGAGKSTLLKLLSRVTAPTTGIIKTRGRIASLLEVGTGFHPELTGRENIFLNGAILGMTRPEIKSKLDEIIDFSGCERYIDTPTKRYSSGMTVRLAFAVAAHLEPEILVVDEVLAVGDAEFQKKAIGKMQDISHGEGRTVLFVSHNMGSVRNLCTRGIILKAGTVELQGDINNVVDVYLKDSRSLSKFDSKFIEGIVINQKIEDSKTIYLGEDLTINIQFKDTYTEEVDYCFVGIYNSENIRVTSFGTHQDQRFVRSLFKGKCLECSIPSFKLAPGEYSLMVAVGTAVPQRNLEVIESAIYFTVVDQNYFGNGITLLSGQGFIVTDSRWRI